MLAATRNLRHGLFHATCVVSASAFALFIQRTKAHADIVACGQDAHARARVLGAMWKALPEVGRQQLADEASGVAQMRVVLAQDRMAAEVKEEKRMMTKGRGIKLFMQRMQDHPDIKDKGGGERGKALGAMWKALSDDEKAQLKIEAAATPRKTVREPAQQTDDATTTKNIGISPFALFMQQTKDHPDLKGKGMSIGERGKAVGEMYDAVSDDEMAQLEIEAAATPRKTVKERDHVKMLKKQQHASRSICPVKCPVKLFMQRMQDHPDIKDKGGGERGKALDTMWKALSDDEKAQFKIEAAATPPSQTKNRGISRFFFQKRVLIHTHMPAVFSAAATAPRLRLVQGRGPARQRPTRRARVPPPDPPHHAALGAVGTCVSDRAAHDDG